MKKIKLLMLFIARFFLSLIFIVSAFKKIFNWQYSENELIEVFLRWNSLASIGSIKSLFSELISWVPFLLILTTVLEFLGSIMILFGIKPKLGVVFLFFTLFFSNLVFQHFWFIDFPEKELLLQNFLKNTAILGGLIYVIIFGTKVKIYGIQLSRGEGV